MFRRSRVSLAAALAVGGLAMRRDRAAIAQDSGQRVEVTGSRIKRTDTETASPVQVLTREDIERTGKPSIQDSAARRDRRWRWARSRLVLQRIRQRLGRGLAARPGRQLDAGAGQRPPHDDLWPGRRRHAQLRRPQLVAAGSGRAHRSAEGRRVGHLRCGRGGWRGQRHPAQELHRCARSVAPTARPARAMARRRAHSARSASATSTPTSTTSSSRSRRRSRRTSGRRTAASSARPISPRAATTTSPTAPIAPTSVLRRRRPTRPTA